MARMLTAGRTRIAVGVWLAILAASYLWGKSLPGRELHLNDIPPLFAGLRHHPHTLTMLPAAVVAIVAIVVLPKVAQNWAWRRMLLVSWIACGAWAVSLAIADGFGRLAEPLTTKYEYLTGVPYVGDSWGSLHTFLRTFTARLPAYPTHVKGHGPLALLPFWALARIGLPQPSAAATMVIALGTSSIVAVAITMRLLIGEAAARRALPFLVLMPGVLWIATSGDAMFLGVSAWGMALLAVATTKHGRTSVLYALAAGLLLGGTAYMSYGLLVLALLPLAVVVAQRRGALVVPLVAGAALVAIAFGLEGFDYISGFEATKRAFNAGVGPARSRTYFALGNIGDLCLSVGPVLTIGLANLRTRRLAYLVVPVVIAVVLSDSTGFVRGEAERIWLPFVPWLTAAVADLRLTPRSRTALLAAQAITALVIQSFVIGPW
jgi:hypothetical protein